MTGHVRLGVLTPSSNTALEPITQAMLAGIPEVSVHFARFAVTEIALGASALAQFDDARILHAAELLAHAHVDVIVWNGTSSAWLSWEAAERLCRRISEATGIVATTSMLALNEILLKHRQRRLGLVTPYTYDVQARLAANYKTINITCVVERHFGVADDFRFSEIP
jgi:maleate isomerase